MLPPRQPRIFTRLAHWQLLDIIKGHLPHAHMYADDTRLYLAFKLNLILQ